MNKLMSDKKKAVHELWAASEVVGPPNDNTVPLYNVGNGCLAVVVRRYIINATFHFPAATLENRSAGKRRFGGQT